MTCKYWYNALVSGDINTFLSRSRKFYISYDHQFCHLSQNTIWDVFVLISQSKICKIDFAFVIIFLYNSHCFSVVYKNFFILFFFLSSKAARCPRRAELAEVEMEATQLSPTQGNNILSCLITSKQLNMHFLGANFKCFLNLIIYHCNCETFCSGKLHFRMGTVCSSRRRCK